MSQNKNNLGKTIKAFVDPLEEYADNAVIIAPPVLVISPGVQADTVVRPVEGNSMLVWHGWDVSSAMHILNGNRNRAGEFLRMVGYLSTRPGEPQWVIHWPLTERGCLDDPDKAHSYLMGISGLVAKENTEDHKRIQSGMEWQLAQALGTLAVLACQNVDGIKVKLRTLGGRGYHSLTVNGNRLRFNPAAGIHANDGQLRESAILSGSIGQRNGDQWFVAG